MQVVDHPAHVAVAEDEGQGVLCGPLMEDVDAEALLRGLQQPVS